MLLLDAAFPALLAARLRWRAGAPPPPDVAGLDDHLRRDVGLPPRVVPQLPLTSLLGLR